MTIAKLTELAKAAPFKKLQTFCEYPPATLTIYDGGGLYPDTKSYVASFNTRRELTFRHVDLVVETMNALPDLLAVVAAAKRIAKRSPGKHAVLEELLARLK